MARILVSPPGTICSSRTLLLPFSALLLLLLQPPCGRSSPIPGLGGGGLGDLAGQERDDKANMQNLLESLKEQFLQTFNVSGLGPPPPPPGRSREEPPEYMMELYNRFANDRSAMPTANIIRSFKNEGRDSEVPV